MSLGPEVTSVDDLALLPDLTEQNILTALHHRYQYDVIYIRIGDILLSVNPFKQLPIYGAKVGKDYLTKKGRPGRLPPHVFLQAQRAVRCLVMHHTPQSIVLTGESGSGKTECLKMLVAQLTRESEQIPIDESKSEVVSQIGSKLTEALNVLDMFGNAEMPHNQNASRFSILVHLFYSDGGKLIGARIESLGLEKARVMCAGERERNFHVFYHLLAGLDRSQMKQYYIDRSYRIVEPLDGSRVFQDEDDYNYHKDRFEYIREAMSTLGIKHSSRQQGGQDVSLVFGVLAAILHLGNIHFSADPETDEVFIPNEYEADVASVLLSVHSEHLMSVFLAQSRYIRGEGVMTMNDVGEASAVRNALVRDLYSRLFNWLVQHINNDLKGDIYARDENQNICILDFPGFESLSTNSFEQLCHNLADELLHNFITDELFRHEFEDCQKERVRCHITQYNDNGAIVDLLCNPRSGLLAVLDEESLLPESSPFSLLTRLNQQLGRKPNYMRPEDVNDQQFTILHYRGQVTYDVGLFVAKNNDRLGERASRLMRQSRNPLVSRLFSEDMDDTSPNSSSLDTGQMPSWSMPDRSYDVSLSRRTGQLLRQSAQRRSIERGMAGPRCEVSRGTAYMKSIQACLQQLQDRETHHIWCLKPNDRSMPNNFDFDVAARQLASLNATAAARQRRRGFPARIDISDFVSRYKFLAFPLTAPIQSRTGACHRILKESGPAGHDWQIAQTKVFLSWWHVDLLDTALTREHADVVSVQSCVRGFLARRYYRWLRDKIGNHKPQLEEFCKTVKLFGDRMFHATRCQNDHNNRRFQTIISGGRNRPRSKRLSSDSREDRSRRQDNGQRDGSGRLQRGYSHDSFVSRGESDYFTGRMEDVRYMGEEDYNPIIQSSQSDSILFQQRVLRDVLRRKSNLDPSTWCKILCMEFDKEVGKVYVQEREVTIDGSYDPFDGHSLGLGVFRNSDREEESEIVRGRVEKGVSLRRDVDGNIWAVRLSWSDVFVSGYREPANHCLSADVIRRRGRLPFNESIKIFDVKELKSRIGLEVKSSTLNKERLQYQSLIGLKFVADTEENQESPCWICVVNVMALNALDNPEVMSEVQRMVAQIGLKTKEQDMEEETKNIAKQRHTRRSWSKTDQREHLGEKESARRLRMELRKKGEDIKNHMDYSWDSPVNASRSQQVTLAKLQDFANSDTLAESDSRDPINPFWFSSGPTGKSKRSNWAKVKVSLKSTTVKEETEAEAAQKSRFTQY